MPDDKLQCSKLTTWLQLKDNPRVIQYAVCFMFGMLLILTVGVVILYFVWSVLTFLEPNREVMIKIS